ncbi:MAG: hypothetical protein QF450_11360 [Rhodospirillales bacterium]|jgi:hypothetical protein|nr:hypothetical protein [Rhodospirillales bacterium]HJO73364.1 hypothetical protein [Rhodospirillales bacterium]
MPTTASPITATPSFKTVITTGVRPGGTRLLSPMGIVYYRNISDADLDALGAYLRSLKPLPSP